MLVLHSRAREGSTSAVVTVAILVVAAVAAAVATVAAAVAVAHHFFSQGPNHAITTFSHRDRIAR